MPKGRKPEKQARKTKFAAAALWGLRTRRIMTQAALAKLVSASDVHISQLERGHRLPTWRFCYRIPLALCGSNTPTPQELMARAYVDKHGGTVEAFEQAEMFYGFMEKRTAHRRELIGYRLDMLVGELSPKKFSALMDDILTALRKEGAASGFNIEHLSFGK